jgi:hypothetical protein
MPVRVATLLALCSIAAALPTRAQNVTVDKRPPQVERKEFDRAHLPNPPPPLNPNEAAKCETVFHIDLTPRYTPADSRPRDDGAGVRVPVRIDSIRIQLRLETTIWLPKNAPPRIKSHEEGHRTIAETIYKDAPKQAQSAAQSLIGKTVEGQGTTREIAIHDALQKASQQLADTYLANTRDPSLRLQEIYDDLTDFSRNADPPPDKAIPLAFERYKEEQAKKKESP